MSEIGQRKRFADHLIGLGLAAIFLGVLLATARDVGFTRDEGFYFTAARLYRPWFDIFVQDPARAVSEEVINKHWGYNHEHPALMKVLFGFSNRFLHEKSSLLSPATSFRFPSMTAAALAVYLIYIFASSIFGRRAGIFASCAFALMPRVFFHSHLACFDVPITTAWLLVTYLYWKSLSSWKYGLAAGAAFGFALTVKLNAFFLPLVLGCHFVCLLAYRLIQRQRLPKPGAFLFGLVVAPPIFFAHWPWLWHDTWNRLQAYVGFHAQHSHYNTAWFGENIVGAPTPVLLPLVMTLFTVPTVIIALFAGGALTRLRHHLPSRFDKVLAAHWPTTGSPSRDGLDGLLLFSVIFPIMLISLPSVPKFGGTKHWMPAFPFIAVIAGAAASRFSDVAVAALHQWPSRIVALLAIALVLLPPLTQTIASHPFGLASYVPFIGGAPGAATLGMTRQFWGYTTHGVLPWLNAHVPPNGRVEFHDTAAPSVHMFQEEGLMREDIRMGSLGNSSFALLHHELHMIRNEAWIWNSFLTFNPVYVLTYQGVPLVSVYERPATKKADRSN